MAQVIRASTVCVALCLICLVSVTRQQNYPPLLFSMLKFLNEGVDHMNSEPPNQADQADMSTDYDFVVVGAGSAGCVLANRLTEIKEWNVLLIEAGSEENYFMDIPLAAHFFQLFNVNWNYKTVPSDQYCLGMKNHQCKFPRGKVMGGSSVLNYMIYTRGNWRDFDRWASLGSEGWDYKSVLKYFKKLEDVQIEKYAVDTVHRGTGGYQTVSEVPFRTKVADAFVDAGKELGYPTPDINGATQIGFSYHQATMRNGTRCSTARAYLHPIRNRRNLHVMKRARVTKILIEPRSRRAYGVELVHNGRNYTVTVRKEVIVSAGAINSPHLLMVSGIGPAQHLAEKRVPLVNDLPVGLNLMDHVSLGGFTFLINQTASLIAARVLADAAAVNLFLTEHRGPLSIPGGSEALSFHDLRNPLSHDGWPDLELLLSSGTLTSEMTLRKNYGLSSAVYERVYKATEGKDGFLIFPMVMRPKSRGRVMLRDSNPLHAPLIQANYFAHPEDLDVLVAGVRLSQKLMRTKPMRQLRATLLDTPLPGCANITFDTDEYWRCAARQMSFTIYHQSGTCRMGAEGDPRAVVDARLRVIGVGGLRVVDASIMPEITSGHTNAPVIMIAEKASDMIKQDWNVSLTPV